MTGASGLVGTAIRERLDSHYAISGLVRRPVDFPHYIGDVTDFDAILPAFEGIDAVVHLAGVPRVGASFEEALRGNIVGTHNVYEAAARAGVGAVIFASSNHAVAGYEIEAGPNLYDLDDRRVIGTDVFPRPDSYYGMSKAASEALGRQYADLRGLRVFCWRIGWVLRDDNPATADVSGEVAPPLTAGQTRARLRAIYLSHRDAAEFVRRCLEATRVRFGIYYGVSNNPRVFYDMTNAREELGYRPQDSAPVELGDR